MLYDCISQDLQLFGRVEVGRVIFRSQAKDAGKLSQNSFIKTFWETDSGDLNIWYAQAQGFCRYKPFRVRGSPCDLWVKVIWLETKKQAAKTQAVRDWKAKPGMDAIPHVRRNPSQFGWVRLDCVAAANVVALPTGRNIGHSKAYEELLMCDWDVSLDVEFE